MKVMRPNIPFFEGRNIEGIQSDSLEDLEDFGDTKYVSIYFVCKCKCNLYVSSTE